MALRILTCNVNGIINSIKRKQIFNHLQNTNADIILLQETHSSYTTNKIWENDWDGRAVWNSGTNFQCGVAILIKNKNVSTIETHQDTQGRILNVIIKLNNQKYQIVNIYAPTTPQQRPSFYFSIKNYLQPDIPLILGGDFNMVLDSSMNREGGTPSPTHNSGSIELCDIINEYQLLDALRHIHKQNKNLYLVLT